ncbi:cellobiose PTS IIC subunit [Levilactobacillus tangyuanensis]|uniref:Cellobiose PTS IIC subunit n=1 Tax=Levilactobacillus tangyuanensis TaxID=2486021 RepID=A0ABW1TNQ8_9LACO|nr:cellobiose PTS IIC subunit [Levilactobacillus tangyuanensis]
MKNVLIISGKEDAGRLFLGEAKRCAETKQAPLKFATVDMNTLAADDLEDADLLLLDPQISIADVQAVSKDATPIAVIPNDVYGWLNGQALVKFTCDQLDLFPVMD